VALTRQVADHNTLARFRSKRLKGIFKDIFKQVVLLLADEGLLTLKEVFTDGTKIESVAEGTLLYGAMP
jgi:transposase